MKRHWLERIHKQSSSPQWPCSWRNVTYTFIVINFQYATICYIEIITARHMFATLLINSHTITAFKFNLIKDKIRIYKRGITHLYLWLIDNFTPSYRVKLISYIAKLLGDNRSQNRTVGIDDFRWPPSFRLCSVLTQRANEMKNGEGVMS